MLAVDCEAAPDSWQWRCKWYGYFLTVFEFDLICESFYPSVFDFEYLMSITDPYPNAQNLHFYDVDIYYNFI